MKKIIYISLLFLVVSCGKSNEQRIEESLKDVVIEQAGGISIKDYKSLSIEIDTVRVKDIKAFAVKCFPKKEYPKGVPSDFNDEDFVKFTAPLKEHKSDNDIVYLSVKHKYSVFNPILNKQTEVIQYRLLDPVSYKYIANDLRKDNTWFGIQKYEIDKLSI